MNVNWTFEEWKKIPWTNEGKIDFFFGSIGPCQFLRRLQYSTYNTGHVKTVKHVGTKIKFIHTKV